MVKQGGILMTTESALNKDALEYLAKIRNVDIVVGIPSYNNAKTIDHVVRVAAEGLTTYFDGLKALLINSDGGSSDHTRDVFAHVPASEDIAVLTTVYQGMPGKGTALKAVFEACVMLGARGCVVVDADLRSITPEWIKLLAGPIVNDGAGYVTPLYLRHKYDGTITNSLAYPLTRALYGKRVRQPIGGDFGVSRDLAQSYLNKDVWGTETARYGIDIFMTTTAIVEGFDIRQANLGAKIHDPKDPSDLVPMLRQVLGTMFSLMGQYKAEWMNVKGSEAVPSVGPIFEQEPEPVNVNFSGLVGNFKAGVKANEHIWREFLSDSTISEVNVLTKLEEHSFAFPAELWVRIVYEYAVACNTGHLDSQEILNALAPLYFGRTAGFIKETETMNTTQANEIIERLALLFESEKAYLLDAWKRNFAS